MFGHLEETVATNNNDIDLVCKIIKEDCTYFDFHTDGCNRIEVPPVFKITEADTPNVKVCRPVFKTSETSTCKTVDIVASQGRSTPTG